MYVLVEHEKQ